MKISIVTISYNQAKFLERAIRSVLEQDYEDLEYIVVDPGSTDGSLDIINRYQHRLAQILIEPDCGPPDGLNKGFALATGEILAYINADDALLPQAVSSAIRWFKHRPSVDVVVGHGYIVDDTGKIIRRFRSAPFAAWRFAYGAGTVIQQSTFFRRSAYLAAGGFNIANQTSWDAELYLKMGLNGARIQMVNDYWSIFTLHPHSISGSQQLVTESQNNHRRYFRMVMGREPQRIDSLWRQIARIQRWLLDPIGIKHRLSDKLFGPPHLNLF